ncbi:MAG TPA: metalloregulator ArsR/SmtB family transcription factor [Ktedonobacteraceae bacterium]|nr:metalloregulator ArsR/SmtB family transcription factor [Ktedonobacteraceae bacterium]
MESETPSFTQIADNQRFHRRSASTERLIDQFLDAACDASRRSILELLVPPEGIDSPTEYEMRVGEIAQRVGLSTSTTSEHLHHLMRLQLLSSRKEGTVVYYRLRNHHLVKAFHELVEALSAHYATYSGSTETAEAVGD